MSQAWNHTKVGHEGLATKFLALHLRRVTAGAALYLRRVTAGAGRGVFNLRSFTCWMQSPLFHVLQYQRHPLT